MDPHANNSVQLMKSSLGCVDGGAAWATVGAQDRIILISNSMDLVTMMSLPQVISSLSLPPSSLTALFFFKLLFSSCDKDS